jgi:pyochelin synthetase
LIRRWLNALRTNGMLEQDPATGRYRSAPPVGPADVEAAWRRVEQMRPPGDSRAELLDYFRAAGEHLPELMRGVQDPIQLLFPEGRVEIHEVAYNDNFLSRYLNRLVTASVCAVAQQRRGSGPVAVLEVGAGVGGTSVELIPALASLGAEYLFTDVSQFFLNNAAERFRDYPWVRYGLFDLNQDYRGQGLAPNSFDVIVCANVLHYAVDAGLALRQLGELLRPGGWLVFIDMVRDNYQVLTSMEFLFDATVVDFEDVRRGRDATFINLPQWHALLEGAGARTALCLPRQDDVLAQVGFHVFAARFKGDRQAIDPADLTAHLAGRLPEYMLPSALQVVDALPLTGNGKVDRKALRSWLPRQKGGPAAGPIDEPDGALERRLAELWGEVLGVARVGRNQNYFELGGDSLLAAQLVGRIRESVPEAADFFFDSLLRLMLEGSTVASLAAHLREAAEPQGGAARPQASPLVHLGGACEGGPLCVLVHDGSGTLASYDALLKELAGRARLAGLVVNQTEAYLGLQAAVLVERTAGDYGRALLAENPGRLHLVGYGSGGILALEVARQLAEAGADVAGVTAAAGFAVPYLVDDDLLVEYLFLRGAKADPARLGYPAEPALARGLALVLAETPGRVPEGRLASLGGDADLDGVAWCFRRLTARPPEDRLAAIARAVAPPGSRPAAPGQVAALFDVFRHSLRAGALHRISPYAGDVTLLCPGDETPLWPSLRQDMTAFWREACLGDLRVVDVSGTVYTCLQPPNAAGVADLLVAGLAEPARGERRVDS